MAEEPADRSSTQQAEGKTDAVDAVSEGALPPVPELPQVPDLPEIRLPDIPKPPELRPNLPPRPARTDDKREYRQMGLAYTLPAALIAPIVVLTLVGYFIDQRLHTGSRFTLGGALLGTVVGFLNMFRMANRLND